MNAKNNLYFTAREPICFLREEGGFPSEIFTREARTFSEGKPPSDCEHTLFFACYELYLDRKSTRLNSSHP